MISSCIYVPFIYFVKASKLRVVLFSQTLNVFDSHMQVNMPGENFTYKVVYKLVLLFILHVKVTSILLKYIPLNPL